MRRYRDLPLGWTSTPKFHPEFGYMCPSPKMRRGIFVSIALLALGVAVGAMTVARGFAQGGMGSQEVRLARPAIEESTTPVGALPVTLATPTISKGASSAKRTQIDCKDLFGFLLGPTCSQRKTQTARTINRVVTIVVGHNARVLAAIQLAPATEQPRATVNTANASTTQPTGRQTAISKTPTMRQANTRKPHRNVDANAYAAAQAIQPSAAPRALRLAQASTRKPNRKLDANAYAATASYDRYRDPNRKVAFQSAYGWSHLW